MSITNEQVSEALGDMTVLQLCELTRTLEEKWGVKAEVAPVDFYGSAAPAYGGSPGMFPEEEQTEFSVLLVTAGERKIEVIKVVRSATGLGLKEAKDLVEAAPKLIKETIPKAEAEALKAQLEAAGAKVALQ